MTAISRTAIEEAYARIAPHIRQTPVLNLPAGGFGVTNPLSLKLEMLQHTGSFKPRGAFNNALMHGTPDAGIAAASGGNHGIAVAHVARAIGKRASIFVPKTASAVKIEAIRALGADLTISGECYDDAQALCTKFVSDTGALHIHPFHSEATLAGQATIGLEWQAQSPDLDTILVAVGGGGLISGIASWCTPQNIRIVGVEPEGACALHAALSHGGPWDVDISSIAADSLGPKNVGQLVFDICSARLDHVALVTDHAIRYAQAVLWRDFRLIAEPGGATALAALLSGTFRPRPDERVGILLCGGNTDPAVVASLTQHSPREELDRR